MLLLRTTFLFFDIYYYSRNQQIWKIWKFQTFLSTIKWWTQASHMWKKQREPLQYCGLQVACFCTYMFKNTNLYILLVYFHLLESERFLIFKTPLWKCKKFTWIANLTPLSANFQVSYQNAKDTEARSVISRTRETKGWNKLVYINWKIRSNFFLSSSWNWSHVNVDASEKLVANTLI